MHASPAVRRTHLLSVTTAMAIVLVGSAAREARAQANLCIDGFQDGGTAAFQGGFGNGEAAAVKLAAPGDGYPFTIQSVQLLFGDDGGTAGQGFTVNLRVFDDDGESALADAGFPGTQLGAEDGASILSSPDNVSEIVLATPVTVTAGSVWVALFVTHDGAPGVARDDGVAGGRNAIFSGGAWHDSTFFGLTGDWIIRAVVDTPSSSTNPLCAFTGGGGGGEGEGEGDPGGEGEGEGEGEAGDLFISSVNPAEAVAGEEARVTITGGGFVDGVAFRVGSATLTAVELQNDGAALATVPGTLDPGTYDVIAQIGAATFTFPSGFTVVAGGCPGCSAADVTPMAVALLGLAVLRRRRR